MQTLCFLAFAFLCGLSLPSHTLSIQCTNTLYRWPMQSFTLCCEMCPPGEYLVSRNPNTCEKSCKPCDANRFTDTYNVARYCRNCRNCNTPPANMEEKSPCNATHDTVCKCKDGFICNDQACKECVPAPETTPYPDTTTTTTTASPPPPTTAAPTTTSKSHKPIKDTVWFLVIIALLCSGIAFIVVTKIKPLLSWIRSTQGYILAKKPAPEQNCPADDDVCMPVQEVCGKCEQPIDVCVKD